MKPCIPSTSLGGYNDQQLTPWYWRRTDLFECTEPEVRLRFHAEATRRFFSKGETIFVTEDDADRVFYVERGITKIEHLLPTGQSTIFWFCIPGDLFGAGGISGAAIQDVQASAHENCEILELPRRRFAQLILDHPQLGLNVIKFISGRLRLACDSMAETHQRASLRVGRVILRLAESCGQWTPEGWVVLSVRVSHQDIADMANCTRQTVNEVVQALSRRGLLRVERRLITLCEIERLRTILESAGSKERAALFD